MTNPVPPLEYDAPPVNPAGFGLYEAGTVIQTGRPTTSSAIRIMGGVIIRPTNCDPGYGTWETDPCADPDPEASKTGSRTTPPDPFLPVVAWAYDECDPQETQAQTEARAAQTLNLHERLLVESDFAARLLADDGAPASAADIVEAISLLETALGEAGYIGAIHASARWAAYAAQAQLIIRGGPILRTPLGHAWVFGGGYDSVLGTTLTATGPVTIWRDDLTLATSLDPRINRRASIAERRIVAGYECLISSATITAP